MCNVDSQCNERTQNFDSCLRKWCFFSSCASRAILAGNKMKTAVKITCVERAKQYPKGTLHADEGQLFCTSCNVTLDHTRKATIDKHLKSQIHIGKVQKQPKDVTHSVQKQTTVVSAFHKATASRDARNVSQFELVEAFASANIPLYKLDHPKLRDYLSRNVKNLGVLPQSTTLRSQVLPKVFDVAQQELRERVAAASSIVIASDEASDQQDRFILHIVFILPVTSGQQDKMEAVTANLVFLDKVNATTVSRAIIQTLTKFDVDFDKVVVVLTDNATYMTKAVTSLKVLLPNCIHLTCNGHILSLVGETFRRNFPAVDRMIACFKSIFVHCSSRKLRYREFIGRECGSEVPLPPVPVVTRWNSWFRAVAHHAKYVEHFKKFIEAELLVSAPTSALLELNDLFKTDSVRVDVVFIMMNSAKLMDLLTWFENRQVTIHLAYNKVVDLMAGVRRLCVVSHSKPLLRKWTDVLLPHPIEGVVRQISSRKMPPGPSGIEPRPYWDSEATTLTTKPPDPVRFQGREGEKQDLQEGVSRCSCQAEPILHRNIS
ncbi:uncharacterized protein LOC120427632 isoform X1 [Culex pipiens pallens]|uniref:uncharacterized protein LOC120427632 isoform X1 n=1 Tax=Culex pipiens pallens TaxID=42434 RepID=UPI0022AA0B3E|nr:uncharacterized protein LOC120427632 isoform X1 [Culex pipiens pallens]